MSRLRRSSRATTFQLSSVKLLFDENLSPKLAGVLQDEYPALSHVSPKFPPESERKLLIRWVLCRDRNARDWVQTMTGARA